MTISTDTATASYTGNGTTTAFPIPFYFLVDTDVKISKKDGATGTISVLTLNSDYTLTGAGNQAGGTATMTVAPLGGTTPDQLFIERNVDAVQETAYPENGIFPAASHEKALDRLTMLVQQILSKLTFGLFRDPLANTYDAGGNTISNVADAVNAQDVPSLVQVQGLVVAGAAPALAGENGAALVGFKQAGTGAVSITVQDELRGTVSVNQFGAKGDGVTDDTAAIQAAVNSGAARVMFPSRGYRITSEITLPANIELIGAGAFATYILAATANQIVFKHVNTTLADANIGIRNMEIAAGSTTGVTGVAFTLCRFTQLENVVFTGLLRNFDYDRGNTHSIVNCISRGNATNRAGNFRLWSSDDADYIYLVNVDGYLIRNIGNGVNGSPAACYIRRGVSVMLGGINCNDARTGGAITLVLFENDCQGCKLFNGVNGAADIGVNFQIGTGVSIAPSFITIDNFDLDQSVTQAIQVNAGNRLTISNCNITSSGVGSGINAVALNNCTDICIADNDFNGYNTGAGCAVTIFSTASNVEVIGNTIDTCVNGTWIVSSGATGIRVLDNIYTSVTTPLKGAISTLGANCLLRGNSGAVPVAVTPGMPASTVAVTNTQGMNMRVYLSGANSSVKINGLTVGITTPGLVVLSPDDTIALTYTTTPTWQWQAMP